MPQDGSARSDLPAGGQEELGGVSYSERMMADMVKMLANLTIQNQQLLTTSSIYSNSSKPWQQQATAGYSSKPQVQQTTAGYSSRWRPEMVAAYKSPVALDKAASSIAGVPS